MFDAQFSVVLLSREMVKSFFQRIRAFGPAERAGMRFPPWISRPRDIGPNGFDFLDSSIGAAAADIG